MFIREYFPEIHYVPTKKNFAVGVFGTEGTIFFNFYNQGIFETLKNSVTSRCKFFPSMKIDKNS